MGFPYGDLYKEILSDSRAGKPRFKSVLMGDSDSAYITLKHYMERNNLDPTDDRLVIELADKVQEKIATVLPDIMNPFFNVPEERRRILEPGREIVGKSGIFKPQKKRYAIHVIDDEGIPPDDPKYLKIKGIDTQRSDTPKIVQDFLRECIIKVIVDRVSYDELMLHIEQFKDKLRSMNPWEYGATGRISNLSISQRDVEMFSERETDKPQLYYFVKAAMNTNSLMETHKERTWKPITDGDKVSVVKLVPNNRTGVDIVAFPVDEATVPAWFASLPFDVEATLVKMVDKKLDNIFRDSIGWVVRPVEIDAGNVASVIDI